MDLLERYLQAVGQYLPAATKDDTVAELRANLMEQMDARTEELGRPLTDAELGDVLRAHGKPELVALRYLPQRSLIGPSIFPFYLVTLKRTLPLVVFVCAIAQGILFLTISQGSLRKALLQFAGGVVYSVMVTFTIITVIFAAIEWASDRGHLGKKLSEWDPAKLPALKVEGDAAKPKSFAGRVLDLGLHCLWMLYVLSLPLHLYWQIGRGVIGIDLDAFGIAFAPVWHVFYGLLLVLLSIQLVMKVLALRNGVHTWMTPMKLATNLLGVIALGVVASANACFVAASASTDLQKLAAVNHGISLALRIALLFSIIGLLTEGWKYVKRWVPTKQFAF